MVIFAGVFGVVDVACVVDMVVVAGVVGMVKVVEAGVVDIVFMAVETGVVDVGIDFSSIPLFFLEDTFFLI